MRQRITLLAACVLFACACFATAQSNSGPGKANKTHVKQKSKSSKAAQSWREDAWWKTEHAHMSRDLRMTSTQGRRISAINRAASDRIQAAHRAGLRGTALSNRIRAIRRDARRQIERIMTPEQRRAWDWPSWEKRWDARWLRAR